MTVCPNCEAHVETSDLRYETNMPGEPSFEIDGCVNCLKGRGVHFYAEHDARLEEAHWDRRLSEARES